MDSIEEMLQVRDAVLDELKVNLLRAQHRMKVTADSKRRELVFEVGNLVFLKLQLYRQSSLSRRPCEKLSSRFNGPFRVVQRIGEVAYKLELPGGCKIHPVFHVSQLKKLVGQEQVRATIPEQLTAELELCVQPEQLLAVRNAADQQLETLIKWIGLPAFDATWENAALLNQHFPAFNLEDKVQVLQGSIVTDQAQPNKLKVFNRRRLKGKRGKSQGEAEEE